MNVQDLERVHATGFDLEDVKVTFNHDVKIKVSDIDVEGKQGEMLNVAVDGVLVHCFAVAVPIKSGGFDDAY